MPAPFGDPAHHCPYCDVLQVSMSFPEPAQSVQWYDYACEHCGHPLRVLMVAHVSWSLSLHKPNEPPASGEE